jgi:PAS domain S-box-containing protein
VKSDLRIVYLEDDPKDADLVLAMLEAEGVTCRVTLVETKTDFLASLEQEGIDLILADYGLPSLDGISALRIAVEKRPEVPFIFVSGAMGEEVAIEALKMGATDYVLKTRLSRILPSVQRALRESQERVERTSAEEALRRSEEQWRDVFENNPIMYFMVDAAGKIMAVNPFGAEQLGYRVDELLGQPVLKVFYGADREAVKTHLAVCLELLGRGSSWEFRSVRKNGTLLRVRGSAKAVAQVNGPILLIACEDITEQRRAEEALFQAGLEACVSERVRIAREVHDTVLQSFHGLILRFQVARDMLPMQPEEAMQALDGALSMADEAISESRDAIEDLRSEPVEPVDLAHLLRAIGEELAESEDVDPPSFSVTVEGDRRTLVPVLQDEIYRIGREILRNAFRHSGARHVDAEILYDEKLLRLRIRDDGKGIEPQVLEDGGCAGHWGLVGIRERAKRITAQLDFYSEAGAGTEVQLTLPASVAYEKSAANLKVNPREPDDALR